MSRQETQFGDEQPHWRNPTKNLSEYLTIAGVAAVALNDCTEGAADKSRTEGATKGADFKTCAVSDTGSWDDKSFNGSTYEGLEAARNNLGVKINTAGSSSDADFVPNVEAMVDGDYDLIIGVGFKIEEALHQSAETDADIKYTLIGSSFSDADSDTIVAKNGRPLLSDIAGAAFLVGYVAAGMAKTGRVITFGGIQIPSISIFMDGFADGVATYNKAKGADIQLLGWDETTQNGSFTRSFDDQALGRQQTQQFVDQGADIIMSVTDPVGLGVAAAIKENGSTLIIGAGSDWYDANPDCSSIILTSVMKQIGASIEQTIKDSVGGKFSSESYIGSLVNGDISLTPFHDFDVQVPQEFKDEVEKLSGQIKSSELKIESQNNPK